MFLISSRENENGADIREFIDMVEILCFAKLTQQQLRLLFEIFQKFSDSNDHLWREGLAAVMRELDHPEDEVELELLMHEWDCQQRGYLVWNDFISIIAQVIKREELVSKVELDFLALCNRFVSETNITKEALNSADYHITANDLIRVSKQQKKPISMETAEEMIFDACEPDKKMVSLNKLIATIETVHRKESPTSLSISKR